MAERKCFICEWFKLHDPHPNGKEVETGMCHLEPREIKKHIYGWCSHFILEKK